MGDYVPTRGTDRTGCGPRALLGGRTRWEIRSSLFIVRSERRFVQRNDCTEIGDISSDDLNSSTDSLALLFASKYTPSELRVYDPKTENAGQVERELRNRPSNRLRREPVKRSYNRITVRLPYDGVKQLLKLRPGRHNFNPPICHALNWREIVYHIDYAVGKDADDAAEYVKNELRKWQEDVEEYVEWINRDIRKMEDKLQRRARKAVESRKEAVDTHRKAMEAWTWTRLLTVIKGLSSRKRNGTSNFRQRVMTVRLTTRR
ncbi:hypothetical protein [Natrarchaeobius oligotrophus]|uniref:hypothetical protein n=1 Tax=Natrarchaeobius oligotrophus TaxID=3455743 RepID=UPI000F545E8B|nr:hypothetical protein [Natrarchaeobius chitinivorans]